MTELITKIIRGNEEEEILQVLTGILYDVKEYDKFRILQTNGIVSKYVNYKVINKEDYITNTKMIRLVYVIECL